MRQICVDFVLLCAPIPVSICGKDRTHETARTIRVSSGCFSKDLSTLQYEIAALKGEHSIKGY